MSASMVIFMLWMCEFVMNKRIDSPTLSRSILLRIAVNVTVHSGRPVTYRWKKLKFQRKMSYGFPTARRVCIPNCPTINMDFGTVREGWSHGGRGRYSQEVR